MTNSLTLTESECNQILDYLGSKPYIEVYKLVRMIQDNWSQQHQATEDTNECKEVQNI